MTHANAIELCSAVCPWLALVWCLQRAARLLKHPLRGWMLLAATGAIAAVVMVVPAQYVGGFRILKTAAQLWSATCPESTTILVMGPGAWLTR